MMPQNSVFSRFYFIPFAAVVFLSDICCLFHRRSYQFSYAGIHVSLSTSLTQLANEPAKSRRRAYRPPCSTHDHASVNIWVSINLQELYLQNMHSGLIHGRGSLMGFTLNSLRRSYVVSRQWGSIFGWYPVTEFKLEFSNSRSSEVSFFPERAEFGVAVWCDTGGWFPQRFTAVLADWQQNADHKTLRLQTHQACDTHSRTC